MADTTRLELLCGARLVARERGRRSETRMNSEKGSDLFFRA